MSDYPDEEWRKTRNPFYEVSSLGRVRSLRRGCRILSLVRRKRDGYLQFFFSHGETQYVHRAVCAAFHGEMPAPGMDVDHIDGVRHNNIPANLRWLPHAENSSRGHGRVRVPPAAVRQIRTSPNPRLDVVYAWALGVSPLTIKDIRLGRGRKVLYA